MAEDRNAEKADSDRRLQEAAYEAGRASVFAEHSTLLTEGQALALAEYMARTDAEFACPNCGPKMRERQRENRRKLEENAEGVTFQR